MKLGAVDLEADALERLAPAAAEAGAVVPRIVGRSSGALATSTVAGVRAADVVAAHPERLRETVGLVVSWLERWQHHTASVRPWSAADTERHLWRPLAVLDGLVEPSYRTWLGDRVAALAGERTLFAPSTATSRLPTSSSTAGRSASSTGRRPPQVGPARRPVVSRLREMVGGVSTGQSSTPLDAYCYVRRIVAIDPATLTREIGRPRRILDVMPPTTTTVPSGRAKPSRSPFRARSARRAPLSARPERDEPARRDRRGPRPPLEVNIQTPRRSTRPGSRSRYKFHPLGYEERLLRASRARRSTRTRSEASCSSCSASRATTRRSPATTPPSWTSSWGRLWSRSRTSPLQPSSTC